MKKEVDYDILHELSDDDVEVICHNIDLDILLHPIKHNTKKYHEYTRRLGRMDRKSSLAQKNMAKIALELYHKGDNNYYKIFAVEAMKLKSVFQEMTEKELNVNTSLKDLANYTVDEYVLLLSQIEQTPGNNVDVQLFVLQLKMNGIAIDEEKKAGLTDQWKHHCKFKQLKDEFQIEREFFIKQHELDTRDQLKNQKHHYVTLLKEKEDSEKKLQTRSTY